MRIILAHDGSEQATILSEAVLSALEAFFGTALEHRVTAHTEVIQIKLHISADVEEPSVSVNEPDMEATLTWPTSIALPAFTAQGTFHEFLTNTAAHVFGLGFAAADMYELLEQLFANDAVQQRIGIILTAPNSYHRLTGRHLTRIDRWSTVDQRVYAPIEPRPILDRHPKSSSPEETQEAADVAARPSPPVIKAHGEIQVRSLIDVHAWDKAKLKGIGYESYGPGVPPVMALLFEGRDAAIKIFERLQQRVGRKDRDDEICISIIRSLPGDDPHFYIAQISGKLPSATEGNTNKFFAMATRSMTMTPASSVNLDRFLADYRRLGCFFIAPALVNSTQIPDTFTELAIFKRNLAVKDAADVREHDLENVALRIRQNPESTG